MVALVLLWLVVVGIVAALLATVPTVRIVHVRERSAVKPPGAERRPMTDVGRRSVDGP